MPATPPSDATGAGGGWDGEQAIRWVALGLLLFMLIASLWRTAGWRAAESPDSRPRASAGGDGPPAPDWESLHQYYHTHGIQHGHQRAPERAGPSSRDQEPAIDPADPSTWTRPLLPSASPAGGHAPGY